MKENRKMAQKTPKTQYFLYLDRIYMINGKEKPIQVGMITPKRGKPPLFVWSKAKEISKEEAEKYVKATKQTPQKAQKEKKQKIVNNEKNMEGSMKLNGKISNAAKCTPGNSHKNSPIKNRSSREHPIVLTKAEEKEITGYSFMEREEWLKGRGYDISYMVPENNKKGKKSPGAGRFAIAKDEASCPEAIQETTAKLIQRQEDIKSGVCICIMCGKPITFLDFENDNLDGSRPEFSHLFGKSEVEFRQHPENVDFQHKDCNRMWGDPKSLEDMKKNFSLMRNILEREDAILREAEKAQAAGKKYTFGEDNRPRKL